MDKVSDNFKKALVTGASSGLGKGFMEMLLAEDVEVWAASRKPERLPKHRLLHPHRLDLKNPAEVEAFVRFLTEDVPDLDLLINNAGYGVFSPFEEFPMEELTQQMNVLLNSPVILCRYLYKNMRRQNRGAIVNISSLAARFPIPCLSLYNTAKAGLSAFSRSLMQETAGTGVAVIDMQPGDFRTAFNENTLRDEKVLYKSEPLTQLWDALERRFKGGADVRTATRSLRRRLLRPRPGVLVTGPFFQARLAPFLARWVPPRLVLYAVRKYYRML